MELKRSFRSFSRWIGELDIPLLAATTALLFVSGLTMAGITGGTGPFFLRHVVLLVAGFALMMLFSAFNYRYFKNHSLPVLAFYVVVIVLLLVTLGFHSIRGSRAWISFGPVAFEPSELMKLALIIVMAKYFSQRHIHISQFRHVLASGFYLAVPAFIILRQPDLGSAAVLTLIWGGMLMAAGITKRHLFLLAIIGIVAAYGAWLFALKPFQKERLAAFVNPYQDPTGIGYNIIQSEIAIGSGHWFGRGFGKGSQATLGFLPEVHNDFVFAGLAEQFGLAGVLVLLSLIVFLLSRILDIGARSANNFGKLFSVGMAVFIGTHTMVSAAVNIGLLPITGIPFSFLSYGGSHLFSVMIGLGIVQSIKRYR